MADIDVDGYRFDHEPRTPVRDVWEDGGDLCGLCHHEVNRCLCDADGHGYLGDGTIGCKQCGYPMNAHDPTSSTFGVDGTDR